MNGVFGILVILFVTTRAIFMATKNASPDLRCVLRRGLQRSVASTLLKSEIVVQRRSYLGRDTNVQILRIGNSKFRRWT
ncbi:hypothetical protein F5X97DRAFT_49034 [Nemania serpens]|nr:hypothetical protein F5X97DRAFT_49034 [Nemania serpens]